MIGYYNYTVWLTYISTVFASLGIGLCIIDVKYASVYAILCLLICGFLDMFDGKVARTKKDRTEFEKSNGIQLDSFSDLIAFGVLPASISLNIFMNVKGHNVKTEWYFFIIVIILITYVLFGLIRLSYFNALEMERCKTTNEPLKYYTGMPITMASFFMPIVYMLKFTHMPSFVFAWIYLIALMIVGIFFVLKIKVIKAGKKMIIGFSVFGGLIVTAFIILMII